MDSFIKKIFDEKTDEFVHVQFQKFSRGEFKDKAVILYSKGKDKYALSTTYEYANELVRALAEKLGEKKTKVTGPVISTRNLKEMPEFFDLLAHARVKQFAGVKQYLLDTEISGKQLLELLNRFPVSFFALSMAVDGSELKIKPKAPISGKPSTKGADAEIKAGFCKLYTTDKNLAGKFVFDKEVIDNESIKRAEIKHVFQITDITLPKGETEPVKIREKAIRKGKIIRILTIDGKETRKEHDFSA